MSDQAQRAMALEGTLGGHQGAVLQIAWSPDGTQLASVAGDATLRIWSRSGELVSQNVFAFPASSVAWSPDGSDLAVGHDAGVQTRSDTLYEGFVSTVAWHEDGTLFWGSGEHLGFLTVDGRRGWARAARNYITGLSTAVGLLAVAGTEGVEFWQWPGLDLLGRSEAVSSVWALAHA